ncbi:gamma-tubulin complex component 5 [Microdochium nivale]|nr:gamma-tubulin complex component 5 [Microdochium nivale]
MAYAADLGALTDELVEVIASATSARDPSHLNSVRESSLRQLRHHANLRTNQFEVYKQVEGLEERLRVLSRDGLADALGGSMSDLSALNLKWAPDVLHFLLELSDKPVEKTRLADLDLLKIPEPEPEAVLTWDDIAKEDGWADDRHLWENVDFANDSSDDELETDDESEIGADKATGSGDVTISSLNGSHFTRRPEDLIIHVQDEIGLKALLESQSWRKSLMSMNPTRPQHVTISETQAVREVLCMLNGLVNTLFDDRGSPVAHIQLSHTSNQVLIEALTNLGKTGQQLSLLRDFAKQKHTIPLVQVFQSTIGNRLRDLDKELSELEKSLVDVTDSIVVSLAKVLHDLRPTLQLLSSLSDVVSDFFQAKYPHPFRYLELLFDAAYDAQLEGRPQAYEFFATIFLECFQVYIRPIRTWMESGELLDKDRIFFISSVAERLPSHQVWQNQYKLRVTQDGSLVVPQFLHPSIANIFNAGKSIVMLKLLGRHYSNTQTIEPPLDFATIAGGCANGFIPFPEVFNAAFEKWMETKHHAAYATLRQTLFTNCKLLYEVRSLHSVFLMTDGARSGLLTNSIFHNLDLLNNNWHDRLALSQVAQEAFESKIDARRLVVSVSSADLKDGVGKIRTSVRLGLPLVRISYRLPWPLRIVITDESLAQYQAVFTLLLQLRRASHVLHKHKPLADGVADLSQDQTAYYRVRTRLLWFCNVLDTYSTMLVIGPLTTQLLSGLGEAQDVDTMIGVHSTFTKRLVDEMCLGSRLDPIKQCILDVLNLAIKLEDARQAEAQREVDSTQEFSRLSVFAGAGASPTTPRKGNGENRQRYIQPSEEEDQTFLEEEQDKSVLPPDGRDDREYFDTLCDMAAELDRHVRFLCSGLRGVARASTNSAAVKWDTLAEMLEFGLLQEHRSLAM